MSIHPAFPYSFRTTTVTGYFHSQEKMVMSSNRKILPIEWTPSLINVSATFDKEISGVKQDLRLITYYIHALIEKTLHTPFSRTKTEAQGSQAKKGCQAAHSSFFPKTCDDFTFQLIERVEKGGLTPTKSKPLLKQRIGMTSPESKLLNENRERPNFVKDFVLSRLPSGGDSSLLSGTRFYWLNNSTFENPDESNQYDSRLEKKISKFLKVLQSLRLDGQVIIEKTSILQEIPQKFLEEKIVTVQLIEQKYILLQGELSVEDSLIWLIEWLLNYYDQSIRNIHLQLEKIEEAFISFQKMRHFELTYLNSDEVPFDPFLEYLNEVNQFLMTFEILKAKKEGCPSCEALKMVRLDFRFLEKLNHQTFFQKKPLHEVLAFYKTNRQHLAKTMKFDRETYLAKYTLYLNEAKVQKEHTETFTDPCTIPHLTQLLFGVMEEGNRRAPTEKELTEQIFQLFSVATPERKRKRIESSHPSSSDSPSRRRRIAQWLF